MYAYIDGKLTHKNPTYVVIETAGVGYLIHISLHTYGKLTHHEHCKLFTWLYVREDAHLLYGFIDEAERKLFLHLISVSGIGANTARMMLSSLTPEEIQQAIVNGDATTIQRIKGIGAKSAQRLILELQDKLKKEDTTFSSGESSINTVQEEALSALVMLGFVKNQAEKVLQKILKENNKLLSVEELIKLSLKNL